MNTKQIENFQENNLFSRFINIIKTPFTEIPLENNTSLEDMRARHIMQQHIDGKNFKEVFKSYDSGYSFPPQQEQDLGNIFKSYLDTKDIAGASSMVDLGYKLTDKDMEALFFDQTFMQRHVQYLSEYYHDRKPTTDYYHDKTLLNSFISYQEDINNSKKLFSALSERVAEMVDMDARIQENLITKRMILTEEDKGILSTTYDSYVPLFSYLTLNHKNPLGDETTYINIIDNLQRSYEDANSDKTDQFVQNVIELRDYIESSTKDKMYIKFAVDIESHIQAKTEMFFDYQIKKYIGATDNIEISEKNLPYSQSKDDIKNRINNMNSANDNRMTIKNSIG